MKNIIVCGTGDFAREVYTWIKLSEKPQNIKFKGFLDLNIENLKKFHLETYYLGNENHYEFDKNDYILIAITDPIIKQKVVDVLEQKEVNFFNYIHETSILGHNITLGKGNIFCPYSVLTTDVSIGDFNIFNIHASIGHDVKIGSYNTFNSHCDLTGYTTIQDNNFFASHVSTLPHTKIGNNNKVLAGSVVYKGIKNNLIYMGNPARKVQDNV